MTLDRNPTPNVSVDHIDDHKELAEIVQTQGLLSAKPAAGVEGRWYRATDTVQLFHEDGSTWVELPIIDRVALRRKASEKVVYLSLAGNGNDANDGLSAGGAKATLQGAHDALAADGIIECIGVGTLVTNTGSSGGTCVTISRNIKLKGAHGALSVLKFGPDDPTGTVTGIALADGKTLITEDVTLTGPASNVNAAVSIGVNMGVTSGQDTACTFEAYRTNLTSWGQPIKGDGDQINHVVAHTIKTVDSVLRGDGTGNCILHHGGTLKCRGGQQSIDYSLYLSTAAAATTTGATLTAPGGTFTGDITAGSKVVKNVSTFMPGNTLILFHDAITGTGIPGGTIVALQPAHILYLLWGVAFDLDDVDFTGAPGQWLNPNDQDAAAPVVVPDYCKVTNSRVSGRYGGMAALSHKYQRTVFANVDFFHTTGDAIRVRYDVDVDDCNLATANATITVQGSNTPGNIRVRGGTLKGPIVVNIGGGKWTVRGTHLIPTSGQPAFTYGNVSGSCYLEDNTIEAASGPAASVIINNGTAVANRNRCNNGAPGSSVPTFQIVAPADFTGEGNIAQDPNNLIITSGAPTSRLRPRRDIKTAAIASAANTVLDLNHDTFHLSGVAAVNFLWWQDSSATGQKGCAGVVYLVVDGAFSLTAAGNIKPLQTTARTVGSVIALVFDPTVGTYGTFYEIGR